MPGGKNAQASRKEKEIWRDANGTNPFPFSCFPERFLSAYRIFMSEMDPRPPSPALIAGILFVIQIVGMVIMGVTGTLAKLPQAVQFIMGLEVVGIPLIVYLLLKRRENRGG